MQLLINQLQDVSTRGSLSTAYTCKQLTKTLGSKRPAVDLLTVAYCSSVNFAIINATMSLYSIICQQYFPLNVHSQCTGWQQEHIAEYFPWKSKSCERGVHTFDLLAIFTNTEHTMKVSHTIFCSIVLDTAHRRKRHSQCQTHLSGGCVHAPCQQMQRMLYTCVYLVPHCSCSLKVVWNLFVAGGKITAVLRQDMHKCRSDTFSWFGLLRVLASD